MVSKGASEIATAALYIGITITAISGVTTVGIPALEEMQEASSVSNAENLMNELDRSVDQVMSEGEGSTRTVEANIERGDLYFDDRTNSLVYELETEANIISPQTSTREGNIILGSNAQTKVEETEIEGTECYMMENENTRACIKKVGDQDSFEEIDTSELLVLYQYNEEGETYNIEGDLKVELNEIESTSKGKGFTAPRQTGSFIGRGEIIATVQSEQGFTYDVVFRLQTGSDFLQIDVQNFR